MKKIGLVIDEAADLPQEIIEKHQIAVVPVKMDWPEIENLPGENTFQKMREAEKQGIKSFGKTSQPSPKDFIEATKKQLERFDKVLCITLTSKLSGTHNSALQAKNFLQEQDKEKVFIVDSLNASAGESILILQAIDLIKKGKDYNPPTTSSHPPVGGRAPIEEIVRELEKSVPQIHLFGMLEDIKWLEASGRISSTLASLIRRMQKIGLRPLIAIKKGVVTSAGIKTKAKDIPTVLFRQFERETEKLRKENKKVSPSTMLRANAERSRSIRVVITHGDNLKGAQRLKEMIEKEFENTEIAFLNLIDNILGTLVGPDALILAWAEI